eukprot:GEMP01046739.1.p1 GENE.GEMP01046739.1~~GEMP01046739.1.p1  ORF type:complete len:154 (+),score=29.91 GEMP01046739.1:147-608(+)
MTGLQAYGCTSCLDPSVDCGSMMGKGCRVSRLGESELRVVDEDVVLHESDDEVAVCGFEPALPEHAKRAPQELTLEGADATFEGADVASEGAVEEQSTTTTVARSSYANNRKRAPTRASCIFRPGSSCRAARTACRRRERRSEKTSSIDWRIS